MPLKETGRRITSSGSHLALGIIELEGGKDYDFTTRVGNKNAVAGLVSHRENQSYILIEQYRYPFASKIIELVAGVIDKPGLSREYIMIEEVKEEVGFKKIDNMEFICITAGSPGISTERTYLYDIEVSGKRGLQKLGDMEDIEVLEVPIADIHKFLKSKAKEGFIQSPNVGQALFLTSDKVRGIL